MQHTNDLTSLQFEACELTIGSFDGVHVGHQKLVSEMATDAHDRDLPTVVLTFFPHPSVVLRGRQPSFYISTPDEKASLLGELGVDYVITKEFDRDVSRITAVEFLTMLREHLGFKHLWIGEDFALGHRRVGNRHFLKQSSEEFGFELHIFPPVLMSGEVVSSTRVREALRSGDVARVERYLGRPFVIPGVVIEGANRGKGLGFPTANISTWEERAYPRKGVYACLTTVRGTRRPSVTNIGIRPTFDDPVESPVIETYILDFDEDIYGEELELEFVARLRDEQHFPSQEALVAQIQQDVNTTRALIGGRSGDNGG